jgi:hypothetical protein
VKTPSVKQGAHDDVHPQIQFSEEHGIVVVRDPRLFRRGHEAFCRRLVESAARQPGIRSASVALGSATCRVEFDTGWRSAECMARRFAEIMNEAITELGCNKGPDEEAIDWAMVSAFPAGELVSCWQAVHESPDRLRLHNKVLRLDSSIARRVARALREVPGIVACRVASFGRDLTIAFDPSQRAALAVVDAAETCLRRIRPSDVRPAGPDKAQNPRLAQGQSEPRPLGPRVPPRGLVKAKKRTS